MYIASCILMSIIYKNPLVANLPNYGNNYHQNIKILTTKKQYKSIASMDLRTPDAPPR